MKRFGYFLGLACLLSFAVPLEAEEPQQADGASQKARVAVIGFTNRTKNEAYDAAANTITGSLLLVLRGLALYQVLPPDSDGAAFPQSITDANLAAWCETTRTDYVIYGSIELKKNGNLICRLAVFDRGTQKTSISRVANDITLFGIFDASDTLISSVLESVTGTHIGFGSIMLATQGQGVYSVSLDGMPLGDNLFSVDRVVAGTHRLVVTQRVGAADKPIFSGDVSVREGEATEVAFALQYNASGKPAIAPSLGRFFLYWLPSDAQILVDGAVMENQADAQTLLYRSLLLSPGEHSVEITGKYSYTDTVTIIGGQETELTGFTDWSLARLSDDHRSIMKRAHAKRLRQAGGTVFLIGGLASVASSAVVYFLGKDAGDSYESATNQADAADARKSLELYGYVFPALLGTGGLCLLVSSSLYGSSSGAGKLEAAGRQIDRQIRSINKAKEQAEADNAE